MPKQSTIVINGWTIFAHPLFLDELYQLLKKVEGSKNRDPINYIKKNSAKRLAAIFKLAFEVIPEDPAAPDYRQGAALDNEHKHWFRAKFFQQYRLFFRFDSASKVIVYAWVNDEKSKRAYDSKTDAYRVFKKMLDNGCPPDNWDQLLLEAKGSLDRLNALSEKMSN